MSSIRDVARAAGVSVTTVSYVLNNKGSISEETRRRVLDTVERMSYRRNTAARSLRDAATRIIGYAWKTPTHDVHISLLMESFLHHVMQAVEEYDCRLLLFESHTNEEHELDVYKDLVGSGRMDGIILADPVRADKRVAFLSEQLYPFVMFGRTQTELDNTTCWVDVDGFVGIYQATTHLIAQGHQRIAFVGWPKGSSSGDDRASGFLEAMNEHQLPIIDSYLVPGVNSSQSGYDSMYQLCQLNEPPTAVVAVSDTIAYGILRYTYEANIKIAVTGFDDLMLDPFLCPSLTSVRQPVQQAATLLVEMLFNIIGETLPDPKHHLLEPSLIIRESSTLK